MSKGLREFTSGNIVNIGDASGPAHDQLNNLNSDDVTPNVTELDDPMLYPRILNWLNDHDNGPRGSDGANLSRFTEVLVKNGFERIHQLCSAITAAELTTVCSNMSLGQAVTILSLARSDTEKLRKKEIERAKRHPAPKRYY